MNRRCIYLVEGECEEKLINALKEKPALLIPGKIKKFNVIQEELKTSHLVTFPPGCIVVLVFDTDNELTSHLKKNIELLKKRCSGVKVLTVPQVLNFEDEIIRCTDINKAPELTKSPSISEFKTAVNKIKETEFRKLLDRHNFDLNKIWIKTPPDIFSFVSQDSGELKNG